MMETNPLIENLSKKVVIKTIETRDGHVCKKHKAFPIQYKYLKEDKITAKISFFVIV